MCLCRCKHLSDILVFYIRRAGGLKGLTAFRVCGVGLRASLLPRQRLLLLTRLLLSGYTATVTTITPTTHTRSSTAKNKEFKEWLQHRHGGPKLHQCSIFFNSYSQRLHGSFGVDDNTVMI